MPAGVLESLVQDASSWLARLDAAPAWLVEQDDDLTGGLSAGDLEELQQVGSSTTIAVRVLAIDTISTPNRARVEVINTGKVMVVPVVHPEVDARWRSGRPDGDKEEAPMVDAAQTTIYQDYEDAFDLAEEAAMEKHDIAPSSPIAAPAAPEVASLLSAGGEIFRKFSHGLSHEWKSTVEEFRDMGEDLRELAVSAAGMVVGDSDAQNNFAPKPCA